MGINSVKEIRHPSDKFSKSDGCFTLEIMRELVRSPQDGFRMRRYSHSALIIEAVESSSPVFLSVTRPTTYTHSGHLHPSVSPSSETWGKGEPTHILVLAVP